MLIKKIQQIQQIKTSAVDSLIFVLTAQFVLLMPSTVNYSPLKICEKHCRMLPDRGFNKNDIWSG